LEALLDVSAIRATDGNTSFEYVGSVDRSKHIWFSAFPNLNLFFPDHVFSSSSSFLPVFRCYVHKWLSLHVLEISISVVLITFLLLLWSWIHRRANKQKLVRTLKCIAANNCASHAEIVLISQVQQLRQQCIQILQQSSNPIPISHIKDTLLEHSNARTR
jgi:hypothetical protein